MRLRVQGLLEWWKALWRRRQVRWWQMRNKPPQKCKMLTRTNEPTWTSFEFSSPSRLFEIQMTKQVDHHRHFRFWSIEPVYQWGFHPGFVNICRARKLEAWRSSVRWARSAPSLTRAHLHSRTKTRAKILPNSPLARFQRFFHIFFSGLNNNKLPKKRDCNTAPLVSWSFLALLVAQSNKNKVRLTWNETARQTIIFDQFFLRIQSTRTCSNLLRLAIKLPVICSHQFLWGDLLWGWGPWKIIKRRNRSAIDFRLWGRSEKKNEKKRAERREERSKNPFTKSKKKDFSVIRTACIKLDAGRQRKESLKVFISKKRDKSERANKKCRKDFKDPERGARCHCPFEDLER